jgi:PhnB protein
MQFTPYLNFDGDCAEAFRFYAEAMGAEIVMMQTHGQSPMAGKAPPEWNDRVLHARLVLRDGVLMGSDAPPQYFQPAQGLSVSFQASDAAEAERVFAALAEGGNVSMPIGETFWAERFGMVTDRFGTPWMVNFEKGEAKP